MVARCSSPCAVLHDSAPESAVTPNDVAVGELTHRTAVPLLRLGRLIAANCWSWS